jgi:BirA family biotin operon repressor/biotin-[acetyl-CoA-carboxylase] ligase
MNLISLKSVGSTNDHAKMLAREGAPEGTVVCAEEQTAGRGRHGNLWTSVPGNLFCTFLLRPGAQAALSGQLSFVAAVALSRALKALLPEADIRLKWPNDLLLGGKKAAGILLETESPVDWVVVGIGVNIASAPEGAAHFAGVTAGQVLEKLSKELMSLYMDWKKDGFAAVRGEWLSQAASVGAEIGVRLPKASFYGIFRGIDDAGALLLDMADGSRKTITSGEVFFG